MGHFGVNVPHLLGQLAAVHVQTAHHKGGAGQAADDLAAWDVEIFFPLVCHKADQLIHHRLTVGVPQLCAVIQRHQRHSGPAPLLCPAIQLGGDHSFKVAAVVHAGKKIVVQVLAAQLPFAGAHALLRQQVACQRGRHGDPPQLAVCPHRAVQHAIYPAVAQAITHLQAFVLPAGVLWQLVQQYRFKRSLCALGKGTQILLCPFSVHL